MIGLPPEHPSYSSHVIIRTSLKLQSVLELLQRLVARRCRLLTDVAIKVPLGASKFSSAQPPSIQTLLLSKFAHFVVRKYPFEAHYPVDPDILLVFITVLNLRANRGTW